MRILLIDGDAQSANELKNEIEDHYLVDLAFDGREGDYLAQVNDYAAIVIESNLPDIENTTLCKKTRENEVFAPILMLLEQDDLSLKIDSLDCGADVVLTKPIETPELMAYLRNLIKRNHKALGKKILRVKDLRLDLHHREVYRSDTKIDLRRKEYEILELLMINCGRVVSKNKILEHVWDYGIEAMSNTLEVHIKNLRDKIDRPFNDPLLNTVRGFGYRLGD